MAKFFISMSGEGRGHATRVRSLVERMRQTHDITLFAPGEAYEFLSRDYAAATDVRLVQIPGLKFHYVDGRLHLLKTILEGFRFQFKVLPGVVRQLCDEIRQQQPDVLLSDFEPALPRAARKCGRPFLSLTHQHFLVAYDFSWLPLKLQFFAWFIGLAVPLHYTRQKVTMISSFFPGRLKPRWKKWGAISLGPMIRPEVREGAIAAGIFSNHSTAVEHNSATDRQPGSPFLLSYLRKNTPESVIEELAHSPWPLKIYGLGERPPHGPLTFHAIDPQTFVEDLLACSAVVSAAGNQLLGECMYLGKPVLALPESWHHEQLINACYLQQMGCGKFVTLETFRQQDLHDFLREVENYREQIARTCLGNDGTPEAIEILEAEAARRALGACPHPSPQ